VAFVLDSGEPSAKLQITITKITITKITITKITKLQLQKLQITITNYKN
jgi:hypothetical protein